MLLGNEGVLVSDPVIFAHIVLVINAAKIYNKIDFCLA